MIAYATGALPFRDGMHLADYLDAIDAREATLPAALHRGNWVEEYRARAAMRSLEGFV